MSDTPTQHVAIDDPTLADDPTTGPATGKSANGQQADDSHAMPQVPDDLALRVEAALLTTDRPMSSSKLGDLLGQIPSKLVSEAVAELNEVYQQSGRSFRIEKVAGGFQILTLPQYAQVLSGVHKTRQYQRLSPAAMETLAIIAYKQPILRADIEAIRGVATGEVLRSLMERHLVKIVGRAEEIGRPMLYGTTKSFLEVFGLASLKDMPNVQEFVGQSKKG